MKYQNPILKEIYVEFYFDKEISGTSQYDISKIFSNEYDTVEIDPDFQPLKQPNTRIRLWKNDKKELLQIFNNRIAINNIIGNYVGWNKFLKSCLEVKQIISKHYPNIKYQQVTLSYINGIEKISRDSFCIGKYINCNGEVFPKSIENINALIDLKYAIGNISIDKDNHQIHIQTSIKNDSYNLRLQLIFQKKFNGKDFKKILNILHDNCSKNFNNIITVYVKDELMGGTIK